MNLTQSNKFFDTSKTSSFSEFKNNTGNLKKKNNFLPTKMPRRNQSTGKSNSLKRKLRKQKRLSMSADKSCHFDSKN